MAFELVFNNAFTLKCLFLGGGDLSSEYSRGLGMWAATTSMLYQLDPVRLNAKAQEFEAGGLLRWCWGPADHTRVLRAPPKALSNVGESGGTRSPSTMLSSRL